MMYKRYNAEKATCKHCKQIHEFWTQNCKILIFDEKSGWYRAWEGKEYLVRVEWCPQKANYGYQQKSS